VLVVSEFWLAKARLVGVKVALGPKSPPTPVKETSCELTIASSVMVIEALRCPNWLGVKVTFRMQLASAPRLDPHVLFCRSAKIRPTQAHDGCAKRLS
jgi:hypothetical protein